MKLEIVKSKYPKSYSLLKEYVVKLAGDKGMPKIILDQSTEAIVKMILEPGSRGLFDFFDGYDIIICPICRGGNSWGLSLNGYPPEGQYQNRVDTEQEGFNQGFDMLESKLK